MSSFLRSIAVTVDEPDPGTYCWVLLEARAANDEYRFLSSAPWGTDSYEHALLEGVAELRRLCHAPEQGPRRKAQEDEESPSGWLPLA